MEGVGGGLIFPPSEILDDSSSSSSEGLNNEVSYGDGDDEYSQRQNYSYFLNESYYYNGTYNDTFFIPVTYTYTLGFKIVIALLYNSVFVLALAGNSLVCYVVFSHPRMRTVTNYLISNLAAGDLLMAVFCVPFSYIPVLLQYWPFGKVLCYILSPAQGVSVFVSSYTLVALAVDRYMAILYPLRPRIQKSQACLGIVVVWLLAILTAVPIAIFTEYYQNEQGNYLCDETGWGKMGVENLKVPYDLTLMILQYFFPLIVLIFTYSRIAMAVWGKQSLGEAEDNRVQRLAKTKRKMIKMILTVVIVYAVSWLPINLFIIYNDISPDTLNGENVELTAHAYPMLHLLAILHSVWNPVIYCYMNSRFRDGFRVAVSRVPFMLKIFKACHHTSSNGGSGSNSREVTMDNNNRRRMSYYSNSNNNNRLTRTNTTCTTYTSGSGSLHNNTTATTTTTHFQFSMQPNGNGEGGNPRKSTTCLTPYGEEAQAAPGNVVVSYYPPLTAPTAAGRYWTTRPPTTPLSAMIIHEDPSEWNTNDDGGNGMKASGTMTSIATNGMTPPLRVSPQSSGGGVYVSMVQLCKGQRGSANGSAAGVGVVPCGGTSWSRKGKEVLITANNVVVTPPPPPKGKFGARFLKRKESSFSSSSVSESFM